jgi:hypothetical protein
MSRLVQASLAIIAGALVVLVLLAAFALGANFSNHSENGRGMMGGNRVEVAASADPSAAAAWGRGGMMGRMNDADDRGTRRDDMPCLDPSAQPSTPAQPTPTALPSAS